ncbi:MAG: hypothetical protein AB7E85_02750 [Pseudobdellovibrionaceae bacterium]
MGKTIRFDTEDDPLRLQLVEQFNASKDLPLEMRQQQAKLLYRQDYNAGNFQGAVEWLHELYTMEPSAKLADRLSRLYEGKLNDREAGDYWRNIAQGGDPASAVTKLTDGWDALHAHMHSLRFR